MQSAEMALFETGNDNTALIVRDTEALAGPAAAAQSAIDQGANILLGPVFAAHAKLVAPVASAAHVPVVAFTNDKSVAGGGLYVMGVLPQIQIDREIAYASSQGFKRFAALLPDTPYGHTVADAMGPATARYGVAQAQVEFYQTGAFDYSAVVEKLAADGPFDALLLPDSGVRIHLIAPLLAFYKIDTTTVKILGSAQWTDPSLLKEPALVGAWFAASSNDAWTGFDQRYHQAYGSDPPRIASLGYDAMAMAGTLGKMADFSDAALTRSDGFTGIDGAFRFQADGLVERKLDIIEIQPRGFVVKDPAHEEFRARPHQLGVAR